MAKASASKVVVGDFDDNFGFDWSPLGRSLTRPAARSAGNIAGEAMIACDCFESIRQGHLLLRFDCGSEADVVQQTVFIIEAQQKRPYDVATAREALPIAKASDHTVGRAQSLDLLHALTVATLVGNIEAFGDDAIAAAASRSKLALGVRVISTCGGKKE